jgi:hypothetical protein
VGMFDLILLVLQVFVTVSMWRTLVQVFRQARAQSTVAPWPVWGACGLLAAAALSWVSASLVVAIQVLDLEGGVDALMTGTLWLNLGGFVAVSLLQGGRASYWVLVAFAIPVFTLVSGVILAVDGPWLRSFGWVAVLIGLGWVSCAVGLTLLLLPRSFRFFRAAYLAAMTSKSSETRVG